MLLVPFCRNKINRGESRWPASPRYAQVTGERSGQAGWPGPPGTAVKHRRFRRHDSPVPLAAFARRQLRETGTARPGAMRNRPKPCEVRQAGFEPARIAVTPEGSRLLLCASTKPVTLANLSNESPPNERRRKAGQREQRLREGRPDGLSGHASKTPATPSRTRRWLVSQKQPER
jgi:hypothetical protein